MLTAAEAAERLRISDRTLKKLIKSGALKAMKAGDAVNSGYRITEEALDDYIEQKTIRAMP